MTLLSLLFVIVTGFNLYNFNEKRKELDKLHEKTNEKLEIATKLINEMNYLKAKFTELAASISSDSQQVKNIRKDDSV